MSITIGGLLSSARTAFIETLDQWGVSIRTLAVALVDASGNLFGTSTNPLFILDAYQAASAVTWTSATALNAANAVQTQGYDGVMISIITGAGITGGQIVFEGYDGAAWVPWQAGLTAGYGGATSVTLTANMSQAYQINIVGAQQFRTRLASAITGSGNVIITHNVASAETPDPITVGIDPAGAGTSSAAPVLSPVTPTGAIIKSSAGKIGGFVLTNSASSLRSVKFFNAASVTMGTTTALYEIDIPAGATIPIALPAGIAFSTAIAWAVTAGKGLTDNTTTGLAANDVSGVIFYA